MLQQVLIEALGAESMTSWAAALGQFELNVMLPAIAPRLIESVRHLTHALELLTEKVIIPMKPCSKHLEEHWKSTEQWATLFAPQWGYDQVSEWVLRSRDAGEPFLGWVQKTQKIQITPSREYARGQKKRR